MRGSLEFIFLSFGAVWGLPQQQRAVRAKSFLHRLGNTYLNSDGVDKSKSAAERSLSDIWGNHEVHLVTVETRDEKHKFRFNNISNIGVGIPWRGFDTKLELMLDWLNGLKNKESLAIFVDGGDTLFGGCSEEQFLSDYHHIVQRSGGKRVVIGAERGCYELPAPWTCQDMPVVPQWAHRNWTSASGGKLVSASPLDSTGQARFLNSGFVVGPVGQLTSLYSRALVEMRKCWGACADIKECNHRCHGDQYYITKDFLAYLNASSSNVTLDYASNLVTNGYSLRADKLFLLQEGGGVLHNLVTNRAQCFFHANGPDKKLAKKLRQWQLSGVQPW